MRVVCRRKGRGSARMLLPPSRRAWYRTRLWRCNVSPRPGPQPSERYGSQFGQVDRRGLRRLIVLAGQAAEALVLAPARPDGERHRARSWATSAQRIEGAAWANGNEPSGDRLPEGRHLDPVDPERPALAESASSLPGATPDDREAAAQVAEPGHGLGGADRPRRRGGVRVEPSRQPVAWPARTCRLRLDRAAAQLVGEDRPRERAAWPSPARVQPGTQNGCRRSDRGSCRPPPGRPPSVVDSAGLHEHRVLELRREGEVAVARSGGSARRHRSRAASVDPSRHSVPAGSGVADVERLVERSVPRAPARRRASGLASRARRRRPWACRGRSRPG